MVETATDDEIVHWWISFNCKFLCWQHLYFYGGQFLVFDSDVWSPKALNSFDQTFTSKRSISINIWSSIWILELF